MALRCGIIGLPNVGKSTLFNALTQANIEASNFPFCTIEPNTGVVFVPDPRLDTIAGLVDPERTIAASVEFVDIAGLVEGASKGEGLGNAFLANIRETQALVHVVRCFEDEGITHVKSKIDPVSDAETINTELLLADIDSLEKQMVKRKRQAKSGDKVAIHEMAVMEQVLHTLSEGQPARSLQFSSTDQPVLDSCFLLTAKPMLYLANLDEASVVTGNKFSEQLQQFASDQHADTILMCNTIESEIRQLDDNEAQQEFLQDLGLEIPGLDRLIRAGYGLLDLHTYFTAGKKEVRAWTFPSGSTAQQAAGIIHTDFAKGFIRAEVIGYQDFVDCNGEQGAKEAGKWRLEGKEYPVKDGDLMHFRFNV